MVFTITYRVFPVKGSLNQLNHRLLHFEIVHSSASNITHSAHRNPRGAEAFPAPTWGGAPAATASAEVARSRTGDPEQTTAVFGISNPLSNPQTDAEKCEWNLDFYIMKIHESITSWRHFFWHLFWGAVTPKYHSSPEIGHKLEYIHVIPCVILIPGETHVVGLSMGNTVGWQMERFIVGQDLHKPWNYMELCFVKIHVEHLLETKLHKPNGHRFPNHALIGFQSMPLGRCSARLWDLPKIFWPFKGARKLRDARVLWGLGITFSSSSGA